MITQSGSARNHSNSRTLRSGFGFGLPSNTICQISLGTVFAIQNFAERFRIRPALQHNLSNIFGHCLCDPELCGAVSDSACPPAQFVKYLWALSLRPRHTSLGPHLGVFFNAHRQQHTNSISTAYQQHTSSIHSSILYFPRYFAFRLGAAPGQKKLYF